MSPLATMEDVVVESAGHRGLVRRDAFDSELLGLDVGRVDVPSDVSRPALERLLRALAGPAGSTSSSGGLRRRRSVTSGPSSPLATC
jgi:hypothetical protein